MQVTKVNPTFTGKNHVQILRAQNADRKYLYNEVQDVINKHKVPAIIHNKGIDIEAPKDSNNIAKAIEALKELGIKFIQGK